MPRRTATRVTKISRVQQRRARRAQRGHVTVVRQTTENLRPAKTRHQGGKRMKRRKMGGGGRSTADVVQVTNEQMCANQMLNADHAWVTGTSTGPPIQTNKPVYCFRTMTRFYLSTVNWAAGLAASSRIVVAPSGAQHVSYGTAYDATGAVTAGASIAAQNSSTWASKYDQVSCAGMCVVAKTITQERYRGGTIQGTNYQNVGAGLATVYGLTNSVVSTLPGCRSAPDPLTYQRFSMRSTNPEQDWGFNTPPATIQAGNGCIIVEVTAPGPSATAIEQQTFEFTVYACWAGVPLDDFTDVVASKKFIDAQAVDKIIETDLAALPFWSEARCNARDDVNVPKAWSTFQRGWEGVKGVFAKGASWQDRLGAGVSAIGSFARGLTTVGSWFMTPKEKCLRSMAGLKPEEFSWLRENLAEFPTLDKIHRHLVREAYERRLKQTMPDEPEEDSSVDEDDEKKGGEYVTPSLVVDQMSPRPTTDYRARRAHSVSARPGA